MTTAMISCSMRARRLLGSLKKASSRKAVRAHHASKMQANSTIKYAIACAPVCTGKPDTFLTTLSLISCVDGHHDGCDYFVKAL